MRRRAPPAGPRRWSSSRTAIPAIATAAPAFSHYADAVWDTARMNNIFDHFASAYFALHLKGEHDKQAYFDVIPNGKDAVYAMDREGKPTATHNYWKGFKRGTAVGLMLEHAKP